MYYYFLISEFRFGLLFLLGLLCRFLHIIYGVWSDCSNFVVHNTRLPEFLKTFPVTQAVSRHLLTA